MKKIPDISLKSLFYNDKVLLVFSLVLAVIAWVYVATEKTPEITTKISGVKVTIDDTVPSQFNLSVFGESEFTVDVDVKGKKYIVSSLTADDIVVKAQTNNVDSAGRRTLSLKAELTGDEDYTVSNLSVKTIDVYFDTEKTIQMVIEPDIVAEGFPLVAEGFTCGDINLSQKSLSITGPSTEINRIAKVVAELKLKKSLSSNKSANAKIVPVDDKGDSNFKYLTMEYDKVVLTIPVLRVKELKTKVDFKNAPKNYLLTPLEYSVDPGTAIFNVSVDDYAETEDYSVGAVDFKNLSPSNRVFIVESNCVTDEGEVVKEFTVTVDMTDYVQDYIAVPESSININNPDKKAYVVSELNKPVVIVGKEKDIEAITAEDIKVEVDLSELEMNEGQSRTIPVVVTLNSDSCWVCGTYTVDVRL